MSLSLNVNKKVLENRKKIRWLRILASDGINSVPLRVDSQCIGSKVTTVYANVTATTRAFLRFVCD